MTASEFAFLLLGLVLGVAAGVAIVEVLRSRPPAPREVRVTMAPATVPSRAITLAGDPFDPSGAGPAPGGPGDRRSIDRPARSVAIDDLDAGPPVLWPAFAPVFATAGAPAATAPTTARPRMDVRILADVPAAWRADQPAGSIPNVAAPVARPAIPSVVSVAAAASPAVAIVSAAAGGDPEPEVGGPAPSLAAGASGPCAELRAVADDRCAVAGRAREGAESAVAALREAQRTYDDELRIADEADALADPRAVRSAKEAAQLAFRTARDRAGTRDELETAARTWLAAINRINVDARDAASRSTKARAAANALVMTVERLTAESDAARIAMEVAEEACVAARQAVAECDEAESLAAAAAMVPAPLPTMEPATRYPDDEPELTLIEAGDREARIMRLLRGDRDALLRSVAELAGDDAGERRRWQVALTGLVDAILAQAIDASILDVPDVPAFWAPFTAAQRREIVAALASLGYRFDGLGGFADGRVPSQRDLSLALGYAGLDPMRVRRWPTEAEARELLGEARVAADEYLAAAAGGFTLSELVDLLGRRADGLTDLWNDWGRVRGRLLAID